MSQSAKFESKPGSAAQSFDHGSYDQCLFALKFDPGIAENVFARRAKADLAKKLKEPLQRLVEIPNCHRIWLAQFSLLVLPEDLPATQPKDGVESWAAKCLKHLVKRLTLDIESTRFEDDQTLVLYEGLNTRVQEVAPGQFVFSVKQKWGF